MSKKYLAMAIASGAVIGAVGVSVGGAAAHDRSDKPFATKHVKEKHGHKLDIAAETLGISTEELKSRISDTSFEEVLAEFGYDDKESFNEATEDTLRLKLQEKGLSDAEIDKILECKDKRRTHKIEHLKENFDEDRFRERLEEKGVSDDVINEKLERIEEKINGGGS